MKSIKEIKATARQTLKGQYSSFIVLFLCGYMLESIIINLPNRILAAPTNFFLFISQILLNFLLQALGAMVMLGINRGALLMIRKQKYGVKELVFAFRNQADHFLALELILAGITTISSLPGYIYVWFADLSSMNTLTYSALTSILTGISLIITFILTLFFSMAEYAMLDDPSMTALEALSHSKKLIKGNIFKYILLNLSFIGYLILGFLSAMIGFIWILPYIFVSEAVFYESLCDLEDQRNLEYE